MNRTHAILSALAVACLGAPASAQPLLHALLREATGAVVLDYQVQSAPDTYAPLAAGTPVRFPPRGQYMVSVPLPANFGFRWFGKPVTTVYIDKNGFLSFSSQAPTVCSDSGGGFGDCSFSQGLPISDATFNPVDSLYMWWGPLNPGTGQVSYGTETVGGQQVFTIDYDAVPEGDGFVFSSSSGSSASATVSFEARLYPGGSKIDVVYGALVGTGSAFDTYTVGLQNDGTTSPQLQYAIGLPCSTPSSSFGEACVDADFPANTRITYVWPDKPDLTWTAARLDAASAGAGVGDQVSVAVSGTVANQGNEDAGAFDTQLYFSPTPTVDTTADAGAILVADQPVGGLALGATATEGLAGSFARPASGKYYLVLVADPPSAQDPLGSIDEVDETNNQTALPIYMGTDLTGSVETVGYDGRGGGSMVAEVQIGNQGVDPVPNAFDYNLYILTGDGSDGGVQTQVAIGTVQPGDLPFDRQISVPLPSPFPSQGFTWVLQIDPADAVAEVDETNNLVESAGRLADLVATSLETLDVASPNPPVTRAFFGQQVLLRVKVTNQGAAPVSNFDVGLYLSGGLGGPVITTHDQLLDQPHFASLPAGATLTYDDVVTVPVADANGNPWAAGNFYFGAIADSLSVIGESNEGNNISKVGPMYVRGPGPDFEPVTLEIPTEAAAGEVLPVFRVIRNAGNKGNDGPDDPACPYRYYLSANTTITPEDIPLSILVDGAPTDEGSVKLAIGADSRATELVQIPPGVAPGSYHLGILVDPDHSVDDIDFTNNAFTPAGSIAVQGGPLAVTTSELPEGVAGAGYEVQLLASGGSSYSWTLAPGSTLPEGLSLSSGGLLSGTPGAPGVTPFVVQVSAEGNTASAELVLDVQGVSGPLQVLTENLPSAVAGQSYSGQVVAVGGVPPYAFSLAGGALPQGLSLSAQGLVSGVPSAVATAPATFAVLATDATGATATGQVVLRVSSPRSLHISTGVLPPGTVSQTYPPAGTDNTILAENGTTPYTFAVTAGALPPGLTLSAEPDRVQLVGKPSAAGLFPFSISVTDATGQVDARDYAITVVPDGLSLQQVALPSASPGQPYDADLSEAAVRATWTLYSGALPPGITLDATGHLSGTCDATATPGNYAFIAQAVDRNGRTGVIPEAIAVVSPDKRPVPETSGCDSSSGGAMLLALLPVLGLGLRRRRSAALAAMLLASAPALAHASYSMSSSSASYRAVTGGQPLTSGQGTAASLNLPFTFRFFGQAYSSISVGTSGYIAFGADASTARPTFSGGAPILAVWGDDLEVNSANGGSVSYVINGVAPNRELVIQWADAADAADADETTFNFQAHLHENGQIDFSYGTAESTVSTSGTAAIAGLSDGANNTLAALPCSSQFASCGYGDWPANTEIVFVPGMDLSVPSVTTAGVAFQGTTTNIVVTASDPGGQAVANTSVKVVLSPDGVLSADDTVVATVPNVSLNAGQSQPLTVPFDVGQLPVGSYFFFATINPGQNPVEDDYTNNTFGPVRLDVVAPAPDFAMGTVTASAHTAAPGDTLGVSFSVRNLSSIAGPSTPYAVYLSGNQVISTADVQVGTGTLAPLDGGGSEPVSTQVTLPGSIGAGSYYLGVVVNPTLSVSETDALNDSAFDPVPVAVHTSTLAILGPAGGTLPATSVGAVFQYALSASGGDGHYTFSASAPPPGLSVDSSGLIHGRPSQASQAQPYTFQVGVADGSGHTASETLSLQVSDASLALTVLSSQLVSGEYGLPYSQVLAAVGGVPPYTWSLGPQAQLPDGVSLGPDGVVEGIPRDSGSFSFPITVTDSAAPTPHFATATMQLEISAASLVPRIGSPQLPDATLDVPYQVQLTVSGGFPPYYWQFPYCSDPSTCKPVTRFPAVPTDGPPQAVGMPAGLYFSCDANGDALLTSTPPNVDGGSPCFNPGIPADAPNVPKEAGIYAIPAVITDSASQTVKVVYTVRVSAGQELAITTTELPDALAGRPYHFALQADSPKSLGPIHWSLACSERDSSGQPENPCPESLPPGLSLGDDGTLSGTPTDSSGKTYAFLVRAADGENRVDVRAEAITSHAPEPVAQKGCGSAPGALLPALLVSLLALGLRRRTRQAPHA